jgi:hypothetical protein
MEKREYGWLLPSSQRASVAMWIESNGINHSLGRADAKANCRPGSARDCVLPDQRWLNAILDLSIIPDTSGKIAFASLVQLRIA